MEIVTIDCAEIQSPAQLHEILAARLEFPDYYGKNLDALFDCLTEHRQDRELILENFHHLEYQLKDYSGKLLYVFHEASQENPHLIVTIHP